MARRRQEIGIKRDGAGWRAFVRVNGRLYPKRFPLHTPIDEMRQWRQDQITAHGGARVAVEAGSFAADVAAHLAKPKIAHMPSVDERAAHLALWMAALGRDRPIRSITTDDIEAVIQQWLRTYAPPTVYHRRTSLRSFFKERIGTAGPVDGTTVPDHYRPIDRTIPYATAIRILEAMPQWRYLRRGIRRPSVARLWSAVILHTGIPPAELRKLRAIHFDRQRAIIAMPWRDKGGGTPAHTRELSAEGVEAFVAIDAAGAWFTDRSSKCEHESLSHSFKRAARAVCGPDTPIRLYDLRHTLGHDTYEATRDLATVGRILGHVAGSKVTARYAMGANASVDRQAVTATSAARHAKVAAAAAGPSAALKLPAEVTSSRKQQRQKQFRRVS